MIDLASLKVAAGLDPADSSNDDQLITLEVAAVAHLEELCGARLAGAFVHQEILDGPKSRFRAQLTPARGLKEESPLWLTYEPTDGLIVLIENREDLASSWELVPSTEFELDGRKVFNTESWIPGTRNYRATYQMGYEPGGEPRALLSAVNDLTIKWFNLPESSGISEIQEGTTRIRFAQSLVNRSPLPSTVVQFVRRYNPRFDK